MSNSQLLALYIVGIPVNICLTFFVLHLIFVKYQAKKYKDRFDQLLSNPKRIGVGALVGFFWPIILPVDILVILFVLLVIVPMKLIFSILNKI